MHDSYSLPLLGPERLVEIRNDVFDRFDASREAHEIIVNSKPRAMLRRNIAMRSHGRIKQQTVNIGQRCGWHNHAKRVHHTKDTGTVRPFDLETDQSAK